MFGQAKYVDLSGYNQRNGILGIGPSAGNSKAVESPVVAAFRQGLIDQPVATVWQGKSVPTNLGSDVAAEITYGGVDGAKCGPIAKYHPISAFSSPCKCLSRYR